MVRRSSCGPIACWILARTSSLVTWSLYEMQSILFQWLIFFFVALLWGSMIHKYAGRWMWHGSASVISWNWEKISCHFKLLQPCQCCNFVNVSSLSGLAKTILQVQWKGEEDKADRGRGGKTTSGNGQVWSLRSPRGQWRTWKNGGNWVRNHLWCPNNPHGYRRDDDDDDDDEMVCPRNTHYPFPQHLKKSHWAKNPTPRSL